MLKNVEATVKNRVTRVSKEFTMHVSIYTRKKIRKKVVYQFQRFSK